MDSKPKREAFTINDKINIIVQVDAHIVSNCEDIERCYGQHGTLLQVVEIFQTFITERAELLPHVSSNHM